MLQTINGSGRSNFKWKTVKAFASSNWEASATFGLTIVYWCQKCQSCVLC